jgi:hypothetical protein
MSRGARWWGELLAVGVLGAMGGAVNAWLCYAGIPVPVQKFEPGIIPGGAVHGALLALVPAAIAVALAARPLALRLAAAPFVGWIAGVLSWIPIGRWGLDTPWGDSLFWIADRRGAEILWVPFAYFGLVGLVLYLAWALAGARRGLALSLAAGTAAGVLGSLWWWVAWDRAFFALLHGVVWGALVGLAAVFRREPAESGAAGAALS